jgi:hypothetical protein
MGTDESRTRSRTGRALVAPTDVVTEKITDKVTDKSWTRTWSRMRSRTSRAHVVITDMVSHKSRALERTSRGRVADIADMDMVTETSRTTRTRTWYRTSHEQGHGQVADADMVTDKVTDEVRTSRGNGVEGILVVDQITIHVRFMSGIRVGKAREVSPVT